LCLAHYALSAQREVYFANSNQDGERFNLSTAAIYQQLQQPLDNHAFAQYLIAQT
jgi:guanine deaminase